MRIDPRQLRTRHALADALVRLLETKPLDEIGVAELCREAGVHRTTFYGHFDGVAEFALAEFSQGIDRIAAVEVRPGVEAPADVARRYAESMREILAHTAEERLGYRTLLGPATRGLFRTVLEERMRHRARLALEVWREQGVPGAPVSDGAIDQAAAYISGGLVGAIEVWVLGDETDAAASADRLTDLLPIWWPRGPRTGAGAS
ncbi:TetR/AcrR family transcriptional regulator [Agromyces sp. NPDC058110]|uniref:TetR/AcrR family transcriptional regulator n=1 Tax=Agromyces sp. NPDC058110 TaxID=3346345 RepID=UPI0036DDA080